MTITNLILQFIRNKVILLRFAHYLKKWYGISIMRSRRLSRPNPDHRRRVPMAKKRFVYLCSIVNNNYIYSVGYNPEITFKWANSKKEYRLYVSHYQ